MGFIHWLEAALYETVKFLVFGVGIGYLLKKWIGDYIIRHSKGWIEATERNTAIWVHYMHDHGTDSVLDCHEGRCKVFTQYAN